MWQDLTSRIIIIISLIKSNNSLFWSLSTLFYAFLLNHQLEKAHPQTSTLLLQGLLKHKVCMKKRLCFYKCVCVCVTKELSLKAPEVV